MNEQLAKEIDYLRLALDASKIGDWRWDAATDRVTLSPRAAAILGLPANSSLTRAQIQQTLPPEYRERTQAVIERAIAAGQDYEVEYRLDNAAGPGRWISLKGRPLYDEARTVTGMVGGVQDITRRVEAELELRRSEERFYKAFHSSPIPMSLTAVSSGRFLDVNEALLQTNGYAREEFVGKSASELSVWVVPQDRDHLIRLLKESGTARNLETRFRMKGGEARTFLLSAELLDLDGEPCILMASNDITERKRFEEALTEANRRKDEFLAMLAHELRNPLAPIRNAAHAMRHLAPEPQLDRLRGMIERQVEHLTLLVDDLLDVSRITQGRIHLRKEVIELSTVVSRAVETTRPFLESQRHRLHIAMPDEEVLLEGDVTRLAQILANLLHNAAKYTEEGGTISLRAGREDGEVVIRVADDGIGIAEEMLPHVFDLFAQADRSLDRARGGLGIGLTLVSNLVRMHGGTVAARSDGPGRGSEFIVRLPLCSGVAPRREAPGRAAQGEAGPCRILVVDDHADSAESLSLLLKLEGHDVRTAPEGAGAIAAARHFQPQVVLLDIGLPGMSGYEVAQRLRAEPATRAAVIIAVTGYGQSGDRQRSKAAGFDHHLVKPVAHDILMSLIRSLT